LQRRRRRLVAYQLTVTRYGVVWTREHPPNEWESK
jgi:hypothetical protein